MDSAGHMQSRIDGVLYLAHRIIWKMMTGKDPDRLVDHRDRKGGLLGTHNSKVEAVYARKQGEQLYHGEFAPQ